jgi:glycosyltransferase involved in cell wall biosynthesis
MISFIVPAHNEQALIGRTLVAIHAAARGAGLPYEIIVVNDASTDTTAATALEHGATVIFVHHRHIAATRNSGAHAAQGERFVFVDADTVISPRVLAAALRALDKGAVGGGAPPKMDGPVPLYARLLVFWMSLFMRLAAISGGAFMFCTRDAFHAVGGFDERLFGAEDAALSQALKCKGRFVVLWTRVLTSGRRVRTISAPRMLSFFVGTMIFSSRMLKNRERVEKVWYDSNRENDDATQNSLRDRASNLIALLIVAAVVIGPLWSLPLPASLRDGPLGTLKYGIQIFLCHVGLIVWPCAYLLFRVLLKQKRWAERAKLIALIALCAWVGWNNAREVVWFWTGVLPSF